MLLVFFKTPLMDTFHWDPALLALAFSINMGIIPIPMIIGGKMIDQGKGKLAIILGGIIFSVGFILSGFVQTLPMLLFTYGLIAGFGSGLAFTGNLNNIMKFFPDKRALASGIVLSGVGVGTLLCTQIAKVFLENMSISSSLLWLGVIYLCVLFVTQFFIRSAPAKKDNVLEKSDLDLTWQEMLKTGRFWMLFVILAAGCFAGTVINATSAQIGKQQFGLGSAALVVGLISVFNSVGRICWGYIADKIGNYKTLIAVYFIMILLMFSLSIGKSVNVFYICAVGIGFTYAGVLTVFPSLTSKNFGLLNQGMNYGFMYIGFGIGAVTAPYITSFIGRETQSFNMAFYLSILLLLIGIVLIPFVNKANAKVLKGEK
ncbi:MAG: OFA family MFS transporter [Streptococcus sp.]|nr:OFA family MFS transporter [Streptococcus sp.]